MRDKETVENNRAIIAISVIGGSAVVVTALCAPFLVVPAFRKLGGIPWMVCS